MDATFRYAADREAFAAGAGAAAENAQWIECQAPVDGHRAPRHGPIVAARSSIGRRRRDRDSSARRWEPLTEVPASRRIVVATDRSPEASVLAARDALDERLASS